VAGLEFEEGLFSAPRVKRRLLALWMRRPNRDVARREKHACIPPRADTGAGGGRLLSSSVFPFLTSRGHGISLALPGLHRVRAVHVLPGACVRRVASETRDGGAAARRAARITAGRSSRHRFGAAERLSPWDASADGAVNGTVVPLPHDQARERRHRHRRALGAYRVVRANGPVPHDQARHANATAARSVPRP
jgi:hypothetical protein